MCARTQLLNCPNNLVAGNYRGFSRDQFSFEYGKLGPADTAVRDANEYFAFCWGRCRNVREHQRVALNGGGSLEVAGFHVGASTPSPGIWQKQPARCSIRTTAAF